MDFIIRKDIYGSWWHDFNNDATKINISDFEALIDEVQNTFIIQCKNGSNVPTMGVSIANVKVVNSIISPTPIAFSGAVGLKNLLTTLNYTPYVTAGSGVPQNLTQVLTAGDISYNFQPILDSPVTIPLGWELRENYIESQDYSIGGELFLDNDIIFPQDCTIRFQHGFVRDDESPATLLAFPFTTDSIVYYQGTSISTITINPEDYCMLKFLGRNGDDKNVWILTITNRSSGSGGGTWGSITGTLSAQTDLQTALNGKVDKVAGSRLITSAESTLLGNTSGTNSGDNATNTKYDVTPTTGAVISFATPQVYNSIASPSSSNITYDLTGARIGVVQKIYHNAGTAPTFPAGSVLRGTGSYVTSTLNIIYLEWSVGTTVEYWITQ
jgi:hypothetical protein